MIDIGERCVLCPLSSLIYIYVRTYMMKELKMGMGRRGVTFQKEGKEWRLSGLLYVDDLVLGGESEEDLTAIVGRFIEVCVREEV